jgi:hypothetical protein
MLFNQRIINLTCFIFLCVSLSIANAQVNTGVYFSTFRLPAASFHTTGVGLTGEYEAGETSVYYLSANYFRKTMPVDSISYLPPGGADPIYTKFTDKYNFFHISAGFKRYLAGGTYYDSPVGFYLGAGLSTLLTQLKSEYKTTPSQYEKSRSATMGFEFLLGLDVKVKFVKLFIHGKANIMLKHPVALPDDTALPLLTNTQAGLLVPLRHHK